MCQAALAGPLAQACRPRVASFAEAGAEVKYVEASPNHCAVTNVAPMVQTWDASRQRSVRRSACTALILLLLMGIAAIPGSLIPQRLTNPIAVREFYISDPDTARLYDRFYIFDVFGSPWFSAIYILLFISLIGCVLPRTVEHFKAMRAQPPATPKNLERMEHHQGFAKNSDALTLAEAWFKKNRFRIRNEGTSISA